MTRISINESKMIDELFDALLQDSEKQIIVNRLIERITHDISKAKDVREIIFKKEDMHQLLADSKFKLDKFGDIIDSIHLIAIYQSHKDAFSITSLFQRYEFDLNQESLSGRILLCKEAREFIFNHDGKIYILNYMNFLKSFKFNLSYRLYILLNYENESDKDSVTFKIPTTQLYDPLCLNELSENEFCNFIDNILTIGRLEISKKTDIDFSYKVIKSKANSIESSIEFTIYRNKEKS